MENKQWLKDTDKKILDLISEINKDYSKYVENTLWWGSNTENKILDNNDLELTVFEKLQILKSDNPTETLKEILNGK